MRVLHIPSDGMQRLLAQELKRFEGVPGAFNLEQLDGYFSALQLSPVAYDIADYIEAIWGGGDLPVGGLFDSSLEIQEFFTHMVQYWQSVGRRIDENELFLPLAFLQRPDASFWAQGFLLGTGVYAEQWRAFCEHEASLETVLLAQAYLHAQNTELRPYSEEELALNIEALNQALVVEVNRFILG